MPASGHASSQGTTHFLNRSNNVSQATAPGGVLHFTGTEASLDFTLDPVRDLRLPQLLEVPPNIGARVLETVTNWDRVFVFLYADPDLELGFAEY